jgi:C-terminal processing protease CtpA/Prc
MSTSGKYTAFGIGTVTVVILAIVGLNWFKKPVSKLPAQPPLTVVGVGLYLGRNEETRKFEVRKIFRGSPAEKAGITTGVVLNKVNDALAETNTIKQLSALLMGPVGTKVTLEIIDANGATQQVVLLREPFLNRASQ